MVSSAASVVSNGFQHYERAKELVGANQVEGALREFEIAGSDTAFIATYPHADFYNDWADAFERNAEPQRALGMYKRALEKERDNGHAWFRRARLLEQLGQRSEALTDYQRATAAFDAFIRREPDGGAYPDHLYTDWGRSLVALGQRAAAVERFDQALRHNPEHRDARLGRDEALRGLSDSTGPVPPELVVAFPRQRPPLRPEPTGWETITSDRIGEVSVTDDLFDASRPAMRFARLLAAKKVAPPIALGLFGNWGSGKSFFMGLIKAQLGTLTAAKSDDYVRRVVQIDFNAWHYHDTNLWATIALRIFDGIAEAMKAEGHSAEQIRLRLNRTISSSKARRDEAEAQRQQALKKRADADRELARQSSERAEKLEAQAGLQLRVAWDAISSGPEVRRLKEQLLALPGQLGISVAPDSIEHLARIRGDLEAAWQHGRGLVAAIAESFHGPRRSLISSAWILGVLGAVLGLGWGVAWLTQGLEEQYSAQLVAISTHLAQLGALAAPMLAWVSRQVNRTSRALASASELQARVRDAALKVQREAGTNPTLVALQADVTRLNGEILRSTEEIKEADRSLAEATAEMQRIDQGGLVYDFLQDRRLSSAYLSQLGLVSTVRKDLEQLERLLKDFAQNGCQPIERIILYIDDLDRCQPQKVLDVLQAVHLLLSFKLFHVIVGVDARWLRRALELSYGKNSEPRGEQGEDGTFQFSAHDYLEKIFQIPYALGPLDPGAFGTLINGLVETKGDRDKAKQGDGGAADVATPRSTPDGHTNGNGIGNGGGGSPDAQRDPASGVSAIAAVAPEVLFEDHEEAFMRRLSGFIDRPRLARRFVNIYRLLRARAADEGEGEAFAARPESEAYRVALVLLAINVGYPRIAGRLLNALAVSSDTTFQGFLDKHSTHPRLGAGERDQMAALAKELRALDSTNERHALGLPRELAPYIAWAPRVASFSFDWQRSDPAPASPQ